MPLTACWLAFLKKTFRVGGAGRQTVTMMRAYRGEASGLREGNRGGGGRCFESKTTLEPWGLIKLGRECPLLQEGHLD